MASVRALAQDCVRRYAHALQRVREGWARSVDASGHLASAFVNALLAFEALDRSSDARVEGANAQLVSAAGAAQQCSERLQGTLEGFVSLHAQLRAATEDLDAMSFNAFNSGGAELLQAPVFLTVSLQRISELGRDVLTMYSQELLLKHAVWGALLARMGGGGSCSHRPSPPRDTYVVYLSSWLLEPQLDPERVDMLQNILASESER